MSDIKVDALRGRDLTVFQSNRIYRILASVSNGDIYGKESGMKGRLKEALQSGSKFSRIFVAREGRDGIGVGFFYCDTREGHREFRVKVVVAKGHNKKGVRQTTLGEILLHAKECARMLKRDIIIDTVCKPNDKAVNALCKKNGFFCPPRPPLKKGEKYDSLDLNIHRLVVSHENGEVKQAE